MAMIAMSNQVIILPCLERVLYRSTRSLKFFIWLVGLDKVTLGFGYGFVLEKVSVEYRHFWAVLVGNAH